MTDIAVPSELAVSILALSPTVGLRPPTLNTGSPEAPVRMFTYTPDLDAGEQAAFDRLRSFARSELRMTVVEFDAIRTDVAALRDFRQLGRNAFMALSATERDRRLYDAQTSTTIILLAILRD